ncbi:MAG: succinylglutamate desuccinylase/aspartoacylase family protein [Lentisphaeria bacterium]|nr:succinylglutamate desuccinylase/aspartoacylase family protein [Lentisphaeria bacterium]
MKRRFGIIIAVLLLFVFGGKNWFGQKHAKLAVGASGKTAIQQQDDSKKQETFAAEHLQPNSPQDAAKQKTIPPVHDAFRVTLLSAVPGRTRFRFELADYAIQEEAENGKTYSHVSLNGAFEAALKGKPVLPVIRRDFVAAKGRKANLRIMNVQEDKVVCAPPKPSVGILSRTADIPPVEEDPSVYGGDDVYPSETVAMGNRYVIRGAEGLSVSIQPMRYDFHDGTMVVTRSFEAEITEDGAQAEDYAMRDDEWNFHCILEHRFENRGLLRGGDSAAGVIGTMLFIVPDGWMEQLSDFVAWKEKHGYAVITAGYPSMTGEGADNLAAYIRAAYEDSLVSHVVLFGDRGDIPPYETSTNPNNPNPYIAPTTDVPYSLVDGDDLYADLFISRMAVSTVDELTAVCAKIMAYEGSNDNSWRGRGVCIGSDEKGSYGVTAGRTDWSIVDEERLKLLEDNFIDNIDTVYAKNYTVTVYDIANALNNGCSFVYYVGHGLSHQWTTGRFQNQHAAALQNGAMLPFVASFCCSSANFAYSVKSLGEAFLRNPNGGAIGFLGATAETYWNPPVYSMRQMTQDILNRYSSSRLTCQGAYVCSSIMAGIDYFYTVDPLETAGQGSSSLYAKEMHLLGDCSALWRIGGGRKGVVGISRLDSEQYNVTVRWEDTGEPVVGAAVCIRTIDGATRYAARSDENGMAVMPVLDGKTMLMVSDATWGCLEKDVDLAVAMDTNADGKISNAEVIAYLNTLQRETMTPEYLGHVSLAWEQGGELSMTSRMRATRSDSDTDSEASAATTVATTRGRAAKVVDDAKIREPGGKEPPVNTRSATRMAYWTIDDLNSRLGEWCLQYPEYCREEYVGRSFEGRDIMALRLSCFEGDGDCPEFMIAAGIHGNERIGTWMAMRLAEEILVDLATGGADSVYRPLLSRCALWIIPAMNPDGASAASPKRTNANGHDLNRSFPDGALQTLGTFANGDGMMTGGMVPTAEYVAGTVCYAASEVPETTAFMRFCMEHPCKTALHLHSGDVLIAYPYGNNAGQQREYTASPHDEWYRALADSYQEAYDGDIQHMNAAEWYPVAGEAPDWQYRYTGTLAMTIELSSCKEPMWQEICEIVWKAHEACFASWLTDSLVISGNRGKTRTVKISDALRVTVTSEFDRLMPGENGKVTMIGKGTNGATGGACVLNLACESGMAAEVMGDLPAGIIGSRTESDGSISWLIYSLETNVDESFDVGIHTTDDLNDNDHIASVVLLTAEDEYLMFRRQVLLTEKRTFSWQLDKGWSFISSPLLGETLNLTEPCYVVSWNGERYSDTMDLQVGDFTPGKAFWVYSPNTQTMSLDGRMGTDTPILKRGWNAVGSLYHQTVGGGVFGVERNYGYFTNSMLPGIGYWIFLR